MKLLLSNDNGNFGLLSTHANRQGVDISFTVCLCVCVCTVTDFSGEYKANDVKFCTVVHQRPRQGMSHFGELYSPRSPKSNESAHGGKYCRQTPVPSTDGALAVSAGD